MKFEFDNAYLELKNLVDGYVYSIAQINWWLLKYGDLYKNISIQHSLKSSDFESFIKFYNELDQATQLYKLEEICSLANEEYILLKNANINLREWVIKFYDLYEKLGIYFFRYLEFNSNNDKKLYIAEAPGNAFGVTIQEEDYINSLKFYDTYYDLYENQKLYPEKIKEWDELFARIKYSE